MDEKAAAYPGDAPPYTGAPSSYGVEMGQPVRVQAPHQSDADAPAKDYFALSLFTLLCFWPLGLIALLKSVEVRKHNESGKYDDARKASKHASIFVKLGILIGSISLAVAIFISVITIIGIVVGAVITVQQAAKV